MGVTSRTFYNWERGTPRMGYRQLMRLRDRMALSVDEFSMLMGLYEFRDMIQPYQDLPSNSSFPAA